MSDISYIEMKKILDDNGVSHKEMNKIWESLKESNRIVKNLAEHGKEWYDLPKHLIIDAIKRYRQS